MVRLPDDGPFKKYSFRMFVGQHLTKTIHMNSSHRALRYNCKYKFLYINFAYYFFIYLYFVHIFLYIFIFVYFSSCMVKTYRHMKAMISEQEGVSPIAGKPVKGTSYISVRNHLVICDHQVTWKELKMHGRKSENFIFESKGSMFSKGKILLEVPVL